MVFAAEGGSLVTAVAHMRLAPLDEVLATMPPVGDWLRDGEQARLAAMRSAERARAFLAGRWLAREVVAAALGMAASDVVVGSAPSGQPVVLTEPGAAPLHLSISHAGPWVAVAVAPHGVGVDVECFRRERDWHALARQVFSPHEQAQLRAASSGDTARVFLALWTLKEAHGKRSGQGLRPQAARRVSALPVHGGAGEAWTWELADGALALALAPGIAVHVTGPLPASRNGWIYADA